jgi:hypothetical protein
MVKTSFYYCKYNKLGICGTFYCKKYQVLTKQNLIPAICILSVIC